MDHGELLDIGTDRRRGFSRGVRLAAVALILLSVLGAALVDRRVRDRDEREVAACASEVEAAVNQAGRRAMSAYEYVRPALNNAPQPPLQRGLYGLIADSAQGSDAALTEAARVCDEVSVFLLHRATRERLERCIDVLDAQRRGLAAVAADGAAVMEWMNLRREC